MSEKNILHLRHLTNLISGALRSHGHVCAHTMPSPARRVIVHKFGEPSGPSDAACPAFSRPAPRSRAPHLFQCGLHFLKKVSWGKVYPPLHPGTYKRPVNKFKENCLPIYLPDACRSQNAEGGKFHPGQGFANLSRCLRCRWLGATSRATAFCWRSIAGPQANAHSVIRPVVRVL